jgi:hypothetical protein
MLGRPYIKCLTGHSTITCDKFIELAKSHSDRGLFTNTMYER